MRGSKARTSGTDELRPASRQPSDKQTAPESGSRTRSKRPRESATDRAARARLILERLATHYPDSRCSLDHESPFQLLIATILSAQCTDARVNIVTRELFAKGGTAEALARLPMDEVASIIHSTGFWRNKTKSILGAAKRLLSEFGGVVPTAMEEPLTLPGVARKTANVVLGVGFRKAVGVVVDTHVSRITGLLGLTKAATPEKIEADLMRLFPPDHWIVSSHRFIDHGRAVCIARRPRCADCFLSDLCRAATPHLAAPYSSSS